MLNVLSFQQIFVTIFAQYTVSYEVICIAFILRRFVLVSSLQCRVGSITRQKNESNGELEGFRTVECSNANFSNCLFINLTYDLFTPGMYCINFYKFNVTFVFILFYIIPN